MASKLLKLAIHEAPNQLELSLREAYGLLEARFKPPLKLIVPSSEEYLNLNKATLYGVLCKPQMAKVHIKYLHAIVNDGYGFFVKLLVDLVDQAYFILVDCVKVQLIWVTSVVMDVAGVGFDNLLVSLMRQIVGGDFSDGNLWLSYELVNLFTSKWDLIMDEEPMVLASALFTYLRLIADHYRLPSNSNSIELKRKEIGFCVRVIREQFPLCLRIGRDVIRLLQDLLHVPEFRAVWKDLILNPTAFKTPGFSDISDFYRARTPSRYFLLRITPEMETQLRFLMTHVKLGNQRRHQAWFLRKFIFTPDRETLICDIVRFICCAHHPSNEIIQSEVIPRWAIIGWLLKCCKKKHVEANLKLALFYDWLFFNEQVDKFMNLEPAMLLMVNSVPRYIDMTNSLLEFMILLVDNYDVDKKHIIFQGVSSAFSILLQNGVVSSQDILATCEALLPPLREWLQKLLFSIKSQVPTQIQTLEDTTDNASMLNSKLSAIMEIHTNLSSKHPTPAAISVLGAEPFVPAPVGPVSSHSSCVVSAEKHALFFGDLVNKLGESIRMSNKVGLDLLQKTLFLYVNDNSHERTSGFDPKILACKLEKELKLNGYKLFAPLECLQDSLNDGDEIQSATAIIIRTFMFSQHPGIREMLLFWLRSHAVGARLLSYALRLAYEAHTEAVKVNVPVQDCDNKTSPLLMSHIEAYLSFLSKNGDDTAGHVTSANQVDEKLICKLVSNAFSSYRCMLIYSRDVSSKGLKMPIGEILCDDILSSSEWRRKRFHSLIQSLFSYLPDLSVGDENVIHLLVNHLEHADLTAMQINLSLKRFSIFGEDVDNVFQFIRKSIQWPPFEQHKLWGLVRSELSVSKFPLQRLLLDLFCSADLDINTCPVVIEGLLTLCSCSAPTPVLVGAVMLLPDSKFPNFSAAVLANWIASNVSMFFVCIVDFFSELEKKNKDSPVCWDSIKINQSAVSYMLNYLEPQEVRVNSVLEKLYLSLADIKARSGDPTATMDCG